MGVACSAPGWAGLDGEAEVGFLRNSYRSESFYGAYGLDYKASPWLRVGAKAIVASGYGRLNLPGGVAAGALITAKASFSVNGPTLRLSVAAKIDRNAGFAFLALGFGF